MSDKFRGIGNDPAALRAYAEARRQSSRESFERCDTDGFLSQWASDLTASLYDLQAHVAESNGLWMFAGLYDGDRRIAAKIIRVKCFNAPWKTERKWILRDDEVAKYGRRFIPVGGNSRVRKQLGIEERDEMAPAQAEIVGSGTGLSGAASCSATVVRTGDEWGLDAVLVNHEEVA
jgi:hypothetical protein